MQFACRHESSHSAVKLAKRLCISRVFSTSQCRRYDPVLGPYIKDTAPNPQARNIAVLGGGPSGLATAFNLTRDLPNAKITIFEAQSRIGGWVDSELLDVNDGKVLFEWGPRTLRPAVKGPGLATLQLIYQLHDQGKRGIIDDIIGITPRSPAATNRFVYYPDRLVRMPAPDPNRGLLANLFNAARTLQEPIFEGWFRALATEYTKELRSRDVSDESIGHFLKRRFGASITDNIASAFFHGIYAGDVYKLSMATLLPKLWYMETRDVEDKGGVMLETAELFFRGHRLETLENMRFLSLAGQSAVEEDAGFQSFKQNMRRCVAYTFVKGIGQLTGALVDAMKANSNVTITTSANVRSLAYDKSTSKFSIRYDGGDKPSEFDYVVNSLSPGMLGQIIQAQPGGESQASMPKLPELYESPQKLKAVNAMVVDLYYESKSLPIPPGFGYLIPRSLPLEQNPERALGVLFGDGASGPKGADAIQEWTGVSVDGMRQFAAAFELVKRQAKVPKTDQNQADALANINPDIAKWTETDVETKQFQVGQDTATGTKLAVIIGGHWWDGWSEKDLPSEEEGIEMAKNVIARHLRVTEKPLVAKARLQRDCIPQYQVGYRDHMGKIHRELLEAFDGRLKVMGTWWQGGVGVNDCMQAAQETSWRIRQAWDDQTGLERFAKPAKFVLVDRRTDQIVMDPLQKP